MHPKLMREAWIPVSPMGMVLMAVNLSTVILPIHSLCITRPGHDLLPREIAYPGWVMVTDPNPRGGFWNASKPASSIARAQEAQEFIPGRRYMRFGVEASFYDYDYDYEHEHEHEG